MGLARQAMNDSARLGVALGASWIVAFAGRLLVPRVLGNERYGELAYIESLTLLVTTLLAFGTDTYIRTAVARQREHALEFARPLAMGRLIGGSALAGVFGIAFARGSSSVEQGAIATLYMLGQLTQLLGQTQAAYLHAIQKVKAVSLSSVVSKLVWFSLLAVMMGAGVRLLAVLIALLGAESLRLWWLTRAFHAELGVPARAPFSACYDCNQGIIALLRRLHQFSLHFLERLGHARRDRGQHCGGIVQYRNCCDGCPYVFRTHVDLGAYSDVVTAARRGCRADVDQGGQPRRGIGHRLVRHAAVLRALPNS